MDKANVMKALDMCMNHSEACVGCPYGNMDNCYMTMNEDILVLLKADEKANEKPKYALAYIFTKRENLLKWFNSQHYLLTTPELVAYYERERDVQLILLVRYENNKCICRIKCPINPLPIKGEFEAINPMAVEHLLGTLGWIFKEKINLHMFQ